MHALLLASAMPWLAAQPLPITVESHTLAASPSDKSRPPVASTDIQIPLHGMQASIAADGRVQYHCEQAGSVPDLRFAPPARRQER